jgi:hypothetical protein
MSLVTAHGGNRQAPIWKRQIPGRAVQQFLSPFEALTGVLATVGWTLVLGIGLAALRIETWVFLLLISKPLIDLTWNWQFGEVFHQQVNVQTIVALFSFILTAAVFVQARKKIVQCKAVTAFLAWAALAVVITPSGWGINELVRLYSGAAFFFTAGLILSTREKLTRFTRYFLLTMTVPVCLSFLQAAGIVPFFYWDWIDGQDLGRASGTYNSPLDLIRFLVFAVPLALWLRDHSGKGSADRFISTIFLVLSAPAVALTFHRVGWIVIGLEVLLWLVFTGKARRAPLFVAALLVAGFAFSERVQLLYEPLMQAVRGQVDLESGEFLRGRGANWFVFMNSLFSSNPALWFIGKGGSIAEGADSYGIAFIDFSPNEPHNDFIRIMHAYGIVGLSLYFVILWKFFNAARKLRRSVAGSFDQSLGTLLIIVIVAIVCLSITTEPIRYPTCVWYFFALASTAFCRLRQADLAAGADFKPARAEA